MRNYTSGLATFFMIFFCGFVFGGDEIPVQGASILGGGPTLIVGSSRGPTRFSCTGTLKDFIVIRVGPAGKNQVAFQFLLQDLKDDIFAVQKVTKVVIFVGYQNLGNGLVRFFFEIQNTPKFFDKGSVSLFRGRILLDSDQIILK